MYSDGNDCHSRSDMKNLKLDFSGTLGMVKERGEASQAFKTSGGEFLVKSRELFSGSKVSQNLAKIAEIQRRAYLGRYKKALKMHPSIAEHDIYDFEGQRIFPKSNPVDAIPGQKTPPFRARDDIRTMIALYRDYKQKNFYLKFAESDGYVRHRLEEIKRPNYFPEMHGLQSQADLDLEKFFEELKKWNQNEHPELRDPVYRGVTMDTGLVTAQASHFCTRLVTLAMSECMDFRKKACNSDSFKEEGCVRDGLKAVQRGFNGQTCNLGVFHKFSIANDHDLNIELGQRYNSPSALSHVENSYLTFPESSYSQIPKILKILIFSILAIFAFLAHCWNKARTFGYYKSKFTTPDYSVMLSGLPTKKIDQGVERVIKAQIEEDDAKYHVSEVNLVLETSKYVKNSQKMTKLLNREAVEKYEEDGEENAANAEGDNEHTALIRNDDELKKIQLEIDQYEYKLKNELADEYLTPNAFVSFKSVKQAQRFLSRRQKLPLLRRFLPKFGKAKYNKGPFLLKHEDEVYKLYAKRPLEPYEYFWENYTVGKGSRLCKAVLGFFVYLAIIFVGYYIFYTVKWLIMGVKERFAADHELSLLKRLIIRLKTFFGTFIIILVEWVLQCVVKRLEWWRRPRTMSEYLVNVSKTLWKAQFLVGASYPILYGFQTENLYGRDGMIETITNLYLCYIASHFFKACSLFSAGKLLKCCCSSKRSFSFKNWTIGDRRRQVERFCAGEADKHKERVFTQLEANEVFRDPDWDLSANYAFSLKMFMLCVFHLLIYPLGVLLTAVYVVFYFLAEKWILTRKRSKFIRYGRWVSEKVVRELQYGPVCFGIGACLEEILVRDSNGIKGGLSGFNVLMVLCGVVFVFACIGVLTRCCYNVKRLDRREEGQGRRFFEEKRFEGNQSYVDMNPASTRRFRVRYYSGIASFGDKSK